VSKAISIRQQLLWGLLLVAITGVVGIGVWSWQKGRTRQGGWEGKPVEGLSKTFGKVLDFSLIERSGRRVSLSDLKGRIWIVNFIYTNCAETCPI